MGLKAMDALTGEILYFREEYRTQTVKSVDVRWQERGPRSLPSDYDANAIDTYNDSILVKKVPEADRSPTARPASNRYSSSETVSNMHQANTTLDDIFISVKTTRNYHKWRLSIVLKTWFQLAKNQSVWEARSKSEIVDLKLGTQVKNFTRKDKRQIDISHIMNISETSQIGSNCSLDLYVFNCRVQVRVGGGWRRNVIQIHDEA
ncbi:hypothetical protein RUM43_005384 [Polyplax serrata]|uniref:Fringe-like glycosyltransferase domain-containing protein n=1 Tax=Polyplax serrata TaxID=468196 RepID=A0AAN8NZX8_POLSC